MLADLGRAAVVEISSQIPAGLGFGSSAALCVAAERALATAPPSADQPATVWRGAHEREKVFHGTPSGADTGLAAHQGVGFLSWPDQPRGALPHYEPVPAAQLHLVVAAVPRRGDTKTQVARVAARLHAGDAATRAALLRLGDCSREARELVLQPQVPAAALGAVADTAHRFLSGLGLADPAQDRLLHAGRRAGACGGKLSGAGCGGACFLVCPDAATATRVLDAVRPLALVAVHVAASGTNPRLAGGTPPPATAGRWLHHHRQP